MTADKSTLLLVEDDIDVADMLNAYFRVQGYDVKAVHCGEDAVRAGHAHLPDLIILDIRLPDIDGFEVAQRLRSHRRTEDIPIIFLTEKRNRADRLHGLELGADDYITKPFDVQELRLRVRNALRRSSHGSLSNPVTQLPEGALVDERLRECLESAGWSILVISLDNLDTFHDSYGFVASDDVLRAVGLMIQNAVREAGNPNDFIGQLSPTKFILVTTPVVSAHLAERIRSRLDQVLDYFYPLKDRGAPQEKHLTITIRQQLPGSANTASLSELKANILSPIPVK